MKRDGHNAFLFLRTTDSELRTRFDPFPSRPYNLPPMSISPLPLSYCTNVHPGRSVAEVDAGLDRYTVHVRERFGKPLAAGLWLARPVVSELRASPDTLRAFADGLHRRGLTCHTLNAFPYGDFHS